MGIDLNQPCLQLVVAARGYWRRQVAQQLKLQASPTRVFSVRGADADLRSAWALEQWVNVQTVWCQCGEGLDHLQSPRPFRRIRVAFLEWDPRDSAESQCRRLWGWSRNGWGLWILGNRQLVQQQLVFSQCGVVDTVTSPGEWNRVIGELRAWIRSKDQFEGDLTVEAAAQAIWDRMPWGA